MTYRDRQIPAERAGGGTASKRPVDAAAADAAVDGSSKSPAGVAAHTRLDAGTPAPTSRLENRPHGRPVSHSAHRPSLRKHSQPV